MRAGARQFVGTHDFRNLCQIDVANVQHFVREIISVRIVPPTVKSPMISRMTQRVSAPSNDLRDLSASALMRVSLSAPATVSSRELEISHLRGEDDRWHDLDSAADTEDPSAIYYIQVVGNAFLWHQIRCIAAVLFHIGRRFEPPSVVRWLLDPAACPARPNYNLAPEAPLVLYHAGFERDAGSWDAVSGVPGDGSAGINTGSGQASTMPDGRPGRFTRSDETLYDRMYSSPLALRKASADLEKAWAEAATRTAVLRGLLDRVNALPVTESDVLGALQAPQGGGKKAVPAGAAVVDGGCCDAPVAAGAAQGPRDALTWGEAVAKYGGSAAAWRAPVSEVGCDNPPPRMLPLVWFADSEYAVHGLPPAAVAIQDSLSHGGESGTGTGVRTGKPIDPCGKGAAGGGRGYVPMALRQRGKSVADKWAALSPGRREQATRLHPVNTARLAASLEKGSEGSVCETAVPTTDTIAEDRDS